MRLKDKIAIITGAGTGIGEAIAHKFAREGAHLVLNGLPDDPVQDVAAAILAGGGQAEVYLGDVSEPAAARACVDLAIAALRASRCAGEQCRHLHRLCRDRRLPH